MTDFKILADKDSKDYVSVWDELPLWSAPFGIKILDIIEYKKNINALDIGCGTGFPLIEIAQRLGNSSQCFGIDPWEAAIERLKQKTGLLQLNNIRLFDCKAEEMPFDDNFFNLIVSNNGINNSQNPESVLNECFRISKKNAQMVISANLPGTFSLFYETITDVLLHFEHYSVIELLIEHINQKRKSVEEHAEMIYESGFNIRNIYEDNYSMKFVDGSAFLNHFFIVNNFSTHWLKILNRTNNAEYILKQTESRLNEIAGESNLVMNIPFVIFDCYK